MKEQKVSIAKEIQITPQPVVFMSSLAGIAVTALSVVATSLAVISCPVKKP
jgi:preprotein translocase subunit Sec61beta